MEPILFIFIGWVVGAIGRIIVPANRRIGLIPMILIGMVGSVLGAVVVGTFNLQEPMFALRAASITGAIIGAIVVVFAVTLLGQRYAHV